jgi:hypothetical protein
MLLKPFIRKTENIRGAQMGYGEDLRTTKDELAKLGPKAVKVLADRLESKGRPGTGGTDYELAIARDILDRLEIRRFVGPPSGHE